MGPFRDINEFVRDTLLPFCTDSGPLPVNAIYAPLPLSRHVTLTACKSGNRLTSRLSLPSTLRSPSLWHSRATTLGLLYSCALWGDCSRALRSSQRVWTQLLPRFYVTATRTQQAGRSGYIFVVPPQHQGHHLRLQRSSKIACAPGSQTIKTRTNRADTGRESTDCQAPIIHGG